MPIKTKITHLTTVHARGDTRITVKMCSSLAKNEDYIVSLLVADGLGCELRDGVNIIDIGAKSGGRISRAINSVNKMYQSAIALDSDIYHLHDPELIRIGLKLKKAGKKVIFDAHEDTPKQLLNHPKFGKFMRLFSSYAFGLYEKIVLRKFDFIVTATPYIRDKFLFINPNTVDINNFPLITEFAQSTPWEQKKDEICYIGGIAKIRGIRELIGAMQSVNERIRLNLAGKFVESDIENEVKHYASWSRVNECGFVGRSEISEILSRSKAGIVTLHPIPNYQDALPVKMFEYMAAGIPVVASDFTLWREIISEADCGICVNPLLPQEIANGINWLIENPQIAEKMGRNGKNAVMQKYNWSIEEQKLYRLYEGLVK